MTTQPSYHYLVTIEKGAYMCTPSATTFLCKLKYPLDTIKSMQKFMKEKNPDGVFTHFTILFILELKG